MSGLCGIRPEGVTAHSKFGPLPSSCFFDSIIIPLPAWIRLTITFALFHFVVPVLIVDKIKRYEVRQEWQRHAQLSFYYFTILVVFLMEAMEIGRLAQIGFGVGLLPFIFVGCAVSAVMQATRGAKGRIRNWQPANIIFWIMSVAVTIIKIITVQKAGQTSPQARRVNTDYPTTHQTQDLAVLAACYILLLINEIALMFQKTWDETLDGENVKTLRLTRSISDQARYDLTRAIEEGYYPSGVTYLTLRLEGESASDKDVPGKENELKKTASHNASIAGSSSSEKTAAKRIVDDNIEPVPMIPPSFRQNTERWSSAMTLRDGGADEPFNEKTGLNKKRGSERWSSAMTLKEPGPIRDPNEKRGSGYVAKASPTFENIDESEPLEAVASSSSSRYTEEKAAAKAMLVDSPFPLREPPSPPVERRSFLLKPSTPNAHAERWSAMTLREDGAAVPSSSKEEPVMSSATAPATPERRASESGNRNSMRRYSDCSSRSVRRFSARSDLRVAAATAAAFVDTDDLPPSPEATEQTHLQAQQHPPPSPYTDTP
ncbi:uncharacterized protein CTRU02_204501 [Colletotrichum truncatum]|uniref:Uncharacterized protein n=1 Tax=Colletotrichum truncatum TaxID=5467 RepID=A0ACC3ZC77_COLTU|nr:uncharacterized protein CTRU02_02730 [Colletotrichum truncatum]KAF6797688.1 hypothetical protein CTRU02_02730 [Colletotrichum truncatum]